MPYTVTGGVKLVVKLLPEKADPGGGLKVSPLFPAKRFPKDPALIADFKLVLVVVSLSLRVSLTDVTLARSAILVIWDEVSGLPPP